MLMWKQYSYLLVITEHDLSSSTVMTMIYALLKEVDASMLYSPFFITFFFHFRCHCGESPPPTLNIRDEKSVYRLTGLMSPFNKIQDVFGNSVLY